MTDSVVNLDNTDNRSEDVCSRASPAKNSSEKSTDKAGKTKKSSRGSRRSTSSSKHEEKTQEDTSAQSTALSTSERDLRVEISSVKQSVNAVTTRVDTMLPLLQQLVSQKNVTSGGQPSETEENATSGGHETSRSDIHGNVVDDRISLQPNREESGMFHDSDNDNDSDLLSSASKQDRNFNRFSRYSTDRDTKENGSQNQPEISDILCNIFGDDAKTKPDKSDEGITLVQSQIEVLNNTWHCDNPLNLTVYKDEYKLNFAVSNNSFSILDLPKLDDLSQTLLCKRHGPKAGKSK